MQLEVNIKQNLTLKITQEMQQSLQVLQMSAVELQASLAEKVAENPLLNIEYQDHHVDFKRIEKMALLKNHSGSAASVKHISEDYLHTKRPVNLEVEDIEKHLVEQIPSNTNLSAIEKKILLFYIKNLNESGYLEVSLETAADKFDVPIEAAEKVLGLLHTFEPAGIGARNLKECLLIQIAETYSESCLPYLIVERHLDELAQGSLRKIAGLYKLPKEEVQSAVDFIRSLKPKPLQETTRSAVEYVIPDIIADKVGGEWVVSVNRKHLPAISINEHYTHMMKECDGVTKEYLKANLKDASILIQGLEQRDQTLYRLARLLVEVQADFFEKGLMALKPMRLKDAAELLEVHESTISRAVNSKYIQTPFGVFKLQMLFAKGFLNTEGKIESTSQIKTRIKELIESEDSSKPYSDQKLAAILKGENVQISRRTVAKYREELLISSSAKRVRYS
ncbi:RNA polymerase RpoN-/SigL-like sigma 54 subunit [Planomicrobium soli]|uniref:RNA polymerase RpoN-/SigL-like sigma 54 subunit n=1 Tax=Planomicrobium soli TaxID=1176648 RepID=A0A2P8H5N6_9BACL|nr:RNA polymerase factor sigma-54 [Planomicrobium soli]PSL41542.1 RNA polymerase RpoN-/SigL-like sigma 54 subunit [Planomicrobium soli]